MSKNKEKTIKNVEKSSKMLKNWGKNSQKYLKIIKNVEKQEKTIKNIKKSSEMLKNWKKPDKNILKS